MNSHLEFSDLELAQGFAEREEEKTAIFLERYRPLFQAILTRFGIWDVELQQDLIQGFLLHLMKGKIKKYSGKSKLSTWLTVVFSRYVISYQRTWTRRNQRTLALEDLGDTLMMTGNPMDVYRDSEREKLIEEVQKVLKEILNEDERMVLVLFYYERLTGNKIADLMGKRLKEVYRIKYRALKKLRRELERRGVSGRVIWD